MNRNEFEFKSALSFEREEKFLHALQIYKRLLNDENFKKKAALRISAVYDKLKKSKEATKFLAEYCSENADDSEIVKYLASRFIIEKKYENAVESLKPLNADENPGINFLSGYAYYYLGKFELAKEKLEMFISSGAREDLRSEAFLHLAKSYLNLGLTDEAFEIAEKGEKLNPENDEILFIKGKIYFRRQMYRHAYETVKRALVFNEGEPEYLKLLGKILFKMDEFEKAENYLTNLCSMNCADEETFALLGYAFLKRNEKSKAVKYFEQAITLNPEYNYAKEGLKLCK